MIYITGDKHTDFRNVSFLCHINETTLDDILIVLGDAGINYFANEKDNLLKDSLKTILLLSFAYMVIMKNVRKILKPIKPSNFIKDLFIMKKNILIFYLRKMERYMTLIIKKP